MSESLLDHGLLLYSIAVIKADVTLESVKTGEVRNIDDVPLFIASTGELTTGLLHGSLRTGDSV